MSDFFCPDPTFRMCLTLSPQLPWHILRRILQMVILEDGDGAILRLALTCHKMRDVVSQPSFLEEAHLQWLDSKLNNNVFAEQHHHLQACVALCSAALADWEAASSHIHWWRLHDHCTSHDEHYHSMTTKFTNMPLHFTTCTLYIAPVLTLLHRLLTKYTCLDLSWSELFLLIGL